MERTDETVDLINAPALAPSIDFLCSLFYLLAIFQFRRLTQSTSEADKRAEVP